MAIPENFQIPPADEVRKQLAAALAEVRALRALLRIAKDAEVAQNLRGAAKEGGK